MLTISTYSKLALGLLVVVSTCALSPLQIVTGQHSNALAQGTTAAEKDAFEATKELGTVEAWDAFLSNYPNGFHADLARAYVKKLADAPLPPAAAPVSPVVAANNDFPIEAGSWGGIVRSGPGQSYAKQDSLTEGDTVALMGVSPDLDNGYPWFKIWYGRDQKKGYMWGGILCAKGAERPDVYKTCETQPSRSSNAVERQSSNAGLGCGEPENDAVRAICANSQLSNLDAELNSEYSVAVSNITSEANGGTAADVARFRSEQKHWLSQRNRCGDDISCIKSQYQSRLTVLKDLNQPE